MGSAERRARERNQTRERILTAAREIFVREGFEAVTMRRVADAIEYTPAAIYAHFEDKFDLMTALCDADYGLLREAMHEVEALTDPVDRLRAAGYAYVDFALAHPHHYEFMFLTPWPAEVCDIDPACREGEIKQGDPDQDAYAFLMHLVRACIDARRFAPEYRDVEAVTQACWGAAHGVVSLFITHGRDPWVRFAEPRAVARMLIDAHLRGMLATPTPPQHGGTTP